MKKIFSLMMLIGLIIVGLIAQTNLNHSDSETRNIVDVYIGTPNSATTSVFVPYNWSFQNSVSQVIYRDEEITATGVITAVKFEFFQSATSPVPSNRAVEIWLANVGENYNTFASTSNWVPLEQFTLVYSGSYPLPAASGWAVT